MILAGIDEAGYGPLLGPLVVSATAFEVPHPFAPDEIDAAPCLWNLLRGAVARKAQNAKGRILIADSKVVHNLAGGDKMLERAVLAMLRAMHPHSADALTPATLLPLLGCAGHNLEEHPWYADFSPPLPLLCDPGDLAIASNVLAGTLVKAQVRPVMLRSAVVSERAFNKLIAGTNNKASALVSITLSHLYHLHMQFGQSGLVVAIDKQGGRDHYTSLLLRTFPEAHLKVMAESEESSTYLMTEGNCRTLLWFRPRSETESLPTALASMICKYLRELFMHGFNAWWCRQIPQLKPTAGYHGDGMRWLMEVEPHLSRLGIRREQLVRCR
jgi:hypothetical protein